MNILLKISKESQTITPKILAVSYQNSEHSDSKKPEPKIVVKAGAQKWKVANQHQI